MQLQQMQPAVCRTTSATMRVRTISTDKVACARFGASAVVSARIGARRTRRSATRMVTSAGPQEDAEEARIEAMEKRARQFDPAAVRPPPPKRFGKQEPVKPKPMSERIAGKDPLSASWEVWTGEEGVLWWTNKLAYGAVFVLIGAWVVFRFLGPTLGFYTLKNGFTEVPASLL